jgi:hypothetical protein
MNVIEFRGGDPRIGLVARNHTSGPEADLVKAFKTFVPSCFRWQKGDVALFHEPQMETGFPDLVVVRYNPESFTHWPQARLKLKPLDLKIMHHLMRVKGADITTLFSALGIKARVLLPAMERLFHAGMVRQLHHKWIPRPLKLVFGVRAIVAVEAKIKNWSDAFHQSLLNQWFASECYVLSPVEKPQSTVLERSHQIGVGILLLNGSRARLLSKANKCRIPLSFGSWMFNEWVGRCLNRG